MPIDIDYFSWTNPQTGTVVSLPEGWRHSPHTAELGETSVGYFLPNFSWMMGRYGHVTLHYEDLRKVSERQTLTGYVSSFIGYLRSRGETISEPVFTIENGVERAWLHAKTLHKERVTRLRCRFWTTNRLDFWYAVIEAPVEEDQIQQKAELLVETLLKSTLSSAVTPRVKKETTLPNG